MAEQSLLWTALPNGQTDDGEGLRISVILAPRLDPQGDPAELSSFAPDWIDWPTTLAAATFELHYGANTVDVPMTQTVGPSRVDVTVGTADSVVWTALFHPDLFVRGGEYKDLSSKDILSYDTTAMEKLVAGLYGTLAAGTDGHLPTVTGLLNSPGWDSLVSAVDRLDSRWIDQETGQRDTRAQFADYRENGFAYLEGDLRTLATAQLFHTPPSTPITKTRARQDDPRIEATTTQYEQVALPKKTDFAKQLDFHQIVGAMNPYPTVLRRLGIVIDFVVDRGAYANTADAPLWVTVRFDDGALFVPRRPDASPATHTQLGGSVFEAVSDPSPGPAALRVPGRLLDLYPARFALLEVDVDGAGLKVMNFARSIARLSQGDQRVDSVTRKEKEVGAPSLRTSGLMLVHRERARMLSDTFTANAAKNQKAQDVFDGKAGAAPPDLYAEDVLRGFRFDIWDSTTALWRSLNRREATYLLDGGAVVVEPAAGEEEGTVRLAVTSSSDPTSNADLVWLHEAVVSWTGWSLAAPPPGRAILPNDKVGTEAQTEAELPPGLDFRSRYRAARGSLPRLRFGRRYWIRARAVDLAGNSLPYQEGDFGPERPKEFAREFLRYEPVAGPVVALVKRLDGVTEVPAEGESMNRLAIRSFNHTPADNVIPSTQTARRFAVPQQVSAKEAEQHGVLDHAGKVDSGTFDVLANQKDLDAHDPAASLIEEIIPQSGPLDPEPVDHTFAVYRDGQALTYLPDPLAEHVAVRIFGHPDVDPDKINVIPLYPQQSWPDALPFKVELVEIPGAVPSYDENDRTLRVPLAKGDRASVRLSMMVTKRVLREVLGVWRWIPGAANDELERLALEGQHWMLTPWTTLELVHAVQRPLLDPTFDKLWVDRSLGETSARPRFTARCSIKTTDRLDVRAEWHEPIDDPSAPDSAVAAIDRFRGDTAFSVKITAADEYAQQYLGFNRGGIADHRIIGPDLVEVGIEVGHNLPPFKHHEFHDTRYRRIEYWLEATSKFREYLPRSLLTENVGGEAVETEENIKVVGPRHVTWVPSSAPPPAPEVLYVVPTFGWQRTVAPDGEVRSWRRGGGLRVYLNRSWNASGYGEMLGVVLAPESFGGDPEEKPKGSPYHRHVTQWGSDPIWSSPSVDTIAPKRSAFPLSRTAPDPTGAWLPSGAPSTESDQPPGPFRVTNLGRFDEPLNVAPHDVFYDDDRRLWYCDIEINQGMSYWPFIRLALARYQPVSVGGAELSEIVLADFMPLVADRWLNVSKTNASRTRHVTVSGFSYDDSGSHHEASLAPSMSVIDVLNHTTEELEPANVSATSVVEVWVERLDPDKGEDFGWERVPGAVGHRTGEAEQPQGHQATMSKPSRFIAATDVARGQGLLNDRRFGDLISEDLVDKLFGFLTLWQGTVTMPAAGDNDRLRLVVAEYEEYLVDDSRPYDVVPTKKGRRLVFVEHVELD